MSSRFTATRHTRKRPPVCHSALLDPVKLLTPAHPSVLIATAHWVDSPGTPPVNIGGAISCFETVAGAEWTGIIYYGYQTLAVTVTKTPNATKCKVNITVTANDIPESFEYENVPCPPNLCQWRSPRFHEEFDFPDMSMDLSIST